MLSLLTICFTSGHAKHDSMALRLPHNVSVTRQLPNVSLLLRVQRTNNSLLPDSETHLWG